jgi:hypothetical protein
MPVASTISQELASQVENNMLASLSAAAELKSLLNRLQALVAEQDNGVGAAAGGSAVVAAEFGTGVMRRTVLALTDLLIPVADANAFASQKIYDFPEGRILVHGVTANLRWGVTTTRASTINDNAALDYSLGTAAEAADTTLDSTQANLLAKQDVTLSGAGSAYTALAGAALAAAAQFDGTTTPVDAYLNVSFPTTTDIDGDGTLKVSGTITITWSPLGDY